MWSTLLGEKIIVIFVVLELLTIENLLKIANVTYNCHETKKYIKSCIDFDPECDKFWMYHYKKSGKTGYCYWRYLKNYIDDYIICLNGK